MAPLRRDPQAAGFFVDGRVKSADGDNQEKQRGQRDNGRDYDQKNKDAHDQNSFRGECEDTEQKEFGRLIGRLNDVADKFRRVAGEAILMALGLAFPLFSGSVRCGADLDLDLDFFLDFFLAIITH